MVNNYKNLIGLIQRVNEVYVSDTYVKPSINNSSYCSYRWYLYLKIFLSQEAQPGRMEL